MQKKLLPVEIPQRKGDPLIVDTDEAPRRDTSLETLAKLSPAFGKDGTITAGNAPGVNDGACALVLMNEEQSEARRKKHHLRQLSAMRKLRLNQKNFPQTPGLSLMNC